jgi:TP901 family phage tail tape measure protein
MDGNKFLIEVGVDTSPAEKDLAAFMNKLNSMREKAASQDSGSSSAQLPPQVASAAFSDAPIDLSKQTSDLKEQAKIQRQIVQDRGKLVGLLQEEARISGSIGSGDLQNIRKGAEDALAAAFGSDKLSSSLKGVLTKAINQTVAEVRTPEGKVTQAQALSAKNAPAPPERFATRSTAVLKTVGIDAPTVVRPNVDILKDFNKAVQANQGDIIGVLNSISSSLQSVVKGAESLAGNFTSAAQDQGKALDDMTDSMTETAKSVGKVNDEILKSLADKAKKAAIDSQKSFGGRQKEVLKTVVDNPGITYEELKATGAPPQTIQSLTNRGLKRTGDKFDLDTSALTNFNTELTGVLTDFIGTSAGSINEIQKLEKAINNLIAGVDSVTAEVEGTATAVAQDGLFGEKGKTEAVRKGSVPQDEPAPAKKEKFVQTDFLAQEQTIEDALAAEAEVIEETVDVRKQALELQKQAVQARLASSKAEGEFYDKFDSIIRKYGGDPEGDAIVNRDVVFEDTTKEPKEITMAEWETLGSFERNWERLHEAALEATRALEVFVQANKVSTKDLFVESEGNEPQKLLDSLKAEYERLKSVQGEQLSAAAAAGLKIDTENRRGEFGGEGPRQEVIAQYEAELEASKEAVSETSAKLRSVSAKITELEKSLGLEVSALELTTKASVNLTKAQVAAIQEISKDAAFGQTTLNAKGTGGLFTYDKADAERVGRFAQGVLEDPQSSAVEKRAATRISESVDITLQEIERANTARSEIADILEDTTEYLDESAQWEKERAERAKVRAQEVADAVAAAEAKGLKTIPIASQDATNLQRSRLTFAKDKFLDPLGKDQYPASGKVENDFNFDTALIYDPNDLDLIRSRIKEVINGLTSDIASVEAGSGSVSTPLKFLRERLESVEKIASEIFANEGQTLNLNTLEIINDKITDLTSEAEESAQITREQNAIGGQITAAMEQELKARREAADAAAKAPLSDADKQALANAEQPTLLSSNSTLDPSLSELEKQLILAAERVKAIVSVPVEQLEAGDEIWRNSGAGTLLRKLQNPIGGREGVPQVVDYVPETNYPILGDATQGDAIKVLKKVDAERLANGETALSVEEARTIIAQKLLEVEAELVPMMAAYKTEEEKALVLKKELNDFLQKKLDEQGVNVNAEDVRVVSPTGSVFKKSGPGSKSPLFKLSDTDYEEYINRLHKIPQLSAARFNREGYNPVGLGSDFPRDDSVPRSLNQVSSDYEALSDIIRRQVDSSFEASVTLDQLNDLLSSTALSQEEINKVSLIILDKQRKSLESYLVNNPNRTDTDANPNDQSIRQQAELSKTLEDINTILGLRKEAEQKVVDAVEQQAAAQEDITREILKPDAVIQPSRLPAEVRGPKIPTAPPEIIDVQSASDEDKLAKRLANQEYARQKLARSAAGTIGTEPIEGVEKSAERLSATMDESLTSIKGMSQAMLQIIDLLEKNPDLGLAEFKQITGGTKGMGPRGASLKALQDRGIVTYDERSKLKVAAREDIPGLFKASSDRRVESKRTADAELIAQAQAELEAQIEEYGADVVDAFSDNLSDLTQQYVDLLKGRIEALEFSLGNEDGVIGAVGDIPTPLINKDLYERFGEAIGPEWDFYVEAFLAENSPGLLNFRGTNFSKSDIDSLLFSEDDPQKQITNAANDIRDRIEKSQSRIPGDSTSIGFEDFLSETPNLREANLTISEYVTQLLELVSLSEEVTNISNGLAGLDLSTAMALFGGQLESMAAESVVLSENIANAAREETIAKLEAISQNKAALRAYKQAFVEVSDESFADLSIDFQEVLQEQLRQAAENASATLRGNESILGEASTARTINVDEGQAIDNLLGIQNALEAKIFREGTFNLPPTETTPSVAPAAEAQDSLVNEVFEGAKIEAETNTQRRKNLEKTKQEVNAEPLNSEVFVQEEQGLVSALARKIEALDQQSSLLENIYPSFEEAERQLVIALNRKRLLLNAQADALENNGVSLAPISAIDPFQSGGADGGPKYGVNPYDTMNPGGGGGGGGGGYVGEEGEGFDPVEAAKARVEAAQNELLINIALFTQIYEKTTLLLSEKLAELQAGIKGFDEKLKGMTLQSIIDQGDVFKDVTEGKAEQKSAKAMIDAGAAEALLANDDLLFNFVAGQKLLAEAMEKISQQIFDKNLEANKRINAAWEKAAVAYEILTETNAGAGESLAELFSKYSGALSVFNQQLTALTKEGVTGDPVSLQAMGEAKGRTRIADTVISNQTNQSILDTINNDPNDPNGERNLVEELLDAQVALIRSTSELAELRNQQVELTGDVIKQLAEEDTSILNLKNAREAAAQALFDNLPAGALKDKLALQRRVGQRELNVNDPQYISLRRRENQLRQQEARAIVGEKQAPGLTGKITRYFDYQPDRGGAGFKQFFGGGALAALRYGLPGQIMRSGGSQIVNTIKEAEELQFALARLEGQFKTAFPTENFEEVRANIKAVAAETGLAADEIANFQIQITGAFSDTEIKGVGGTDLIEKQVESAAKLAQTVGLPLAEITDGLTAASLAFGEDFERIGDVAVRLEERSGVLAKETIAFIGDIAPVAEEAGYSIEEFAALAAVAQQRSGRSGAALAESFGRVIPALSEQKDKLMELAQITPSLQNPGFIDAIRQSDSKEILNQIGQAYQSMGKDAQQATIAILGGRREAQALIPALANQELVARLQKDAENSVGSLDKRFEDIQKTLTNSLARLGESVRQFGVELLESGLTDTFELAISLAEKLLGVLTPIAGVFADINKLLGGVPAAVAALSAVGVAFKSFAFKDQTEIVTDPLTGVESENVIGRQFIGTDFIQQIVGNIKEDFAAGFVDSGRTSVERRTGQALPVGPFAAGQGIPETAQLLTAGEKLKAGGTGLLTAVGGGSAALGAGVIGIAALSTAYGAIQGQINATKQALDDLILETKNDIASTDLDVDGARQRLTENLQTQADDARKAYDGWTEFWGELGNSLNPGDYLEGQANVIGSSDKFRDALKIFESSDSLRKDIFDEYKVTLGKSTGGLRDIAKSYKDSIEATDGYIEKDAEGAYRLYNEAGQEMANVALEGQDAKYVENLASQLGIDPTELDFGFVEATLQKDSSSEILNLAKGEEEQLNKYGLEAQEQAIRYVEVISGVARTSDEFGAEIDKLLEDLGKLPPLESNKLKGEELKAAYDVGLLSFEEYSTRLLENIEARRNILENSDQTEASELELLQLKQQEQAAYKEFAEIIIARQEERLRFETAFSGLSETQVAERTRQNNLANLANPNFNDRDLREQAALDIIEADKQNAINMAIAAGSAAEVAKLLSEGVDVSPVVQAIGLIDSLEETDAWKETRDKMLSVFKKLFDIDLDEDDITNWYEKILTDAYDDGQLSEVNKQNILSRLNSNLGALNAASFDNLSPDEQEALEDSFEQLIMLLAVGGVKREELLAILKRNEQFANMTPEELDAALTGILAGSPYGTPEDQAKINYNQAKDANAAIADTQVTNAKDNKIAIAQAKKAEADANLLAAEASGDPKLIQEAKNAQVRAERELQKAYNSAQVAKLEYYATIAEINGDLIGSIELNIQALEAQLALARQNNDEEAIAALEGQIARERDNLRKQAVTDANALSRLYGGLATLRGDLVEAALFAIEEANRNMDAARTPEEKANAALAQAQANADLIKAQFSERARDFDLFAAYLSSNGDSYGAAKTQLVKAQEALAAALRGGNKDEINQARIELLNQEAAFRQAAGAKRDGEFALLSSIIAGDDPVKQAILEQAAAQEAFARAVGPDEIRDATIRLNEANRAVANAQNDVRIAMMGLRQAELEAVEDSVGSAQLGVEIARQQLNDLIKAGAGDAAIANARAALISADKAAKDAAFQERQDEYKWLLDMGRITKSQYINYLEGLKNTLLPGTRQFKDLELAIKQLKSDIGGDLQANLPTSLALPTLYEVRRFNQSQGDYSSRASGQVTNNNNESNLYIEQVVLPQNTGLAAFEDLLYKFFAPRSQGFGTRRT